MSITLAQGATLIDRLGSVTLPVPPQLGGTGVANNSASTLTISGSFGSTFTITGTTSVTFPTSGTLVTGTVEAYNGAGNTPDSLVKRDAFGELTANTALSATTASQIGYGPLSSDATCFLAFFTGSGPSFGALNTNTGLGYNSITNEVTASTEVLTATSNQLILGTTRTLTITAPTPASSSRTGTIPDFGANFVFAQGTAGNNCFFTTTGATNVTLPTSGTLATITLPQSSKSAAYTTVLADAGTEIYHPSTDNNARTFTIDSNANVAYPVGTLITFTNAAATASSIAIASDTMTLAGTTTTGTRTLAQNGTATAAKKTSTTWIISGVGLT